jgi:hypothetical protein
VDFLVRTSQSLGVVKAWQESEAVFFSKLSVWSKKSSPLLSSWKMSQPLELEVFLKSSMPLQKSGMIVGGLVYLPQMLEPLTSEKDGSYLPTPTATQYGSNKGGALGRTGKERLSLETMARKNLWPTPTASDHLHNQSEMLENWEKRAKEKKKQGINLQFALRHAVQKWPTPRASEYKDCGPVGSKSQVHMEKRDYLCAKVKEESKPTGMLSPMWVEWLMGYPTGHTELSALATAWFRCKSEKRSKSLRGSTNG